VIDVRDLTATASSGPRAALPPLHNTWLGMLTGIESPISEPRSTCSNCVMCADVQSSGSRVQFSPDTKCCTYVPHLANFLAGQSLLGPGRASISARIERRVGVTPLGLGLSYADIRRVVGAQSHFGQAEVVICPHFDTEIKGCSIWRTRNAVCSTWFCKHDRGAVSQRFWQAVRDLLIAAEELISHRCLTRAGLPAEQISAVLSHRAAIRETIARANSGSIDSEMQPDDESAGWYERMWGDWVGREEEWFIQSAEHVATIGKDELAAQLLDVRHLAQAAVERWEDLSKHDLPDRLILTPGHGSEVTPDAVRLVGYSPMDPVVLPAALLTELNRIDGRPVTQLRAGVDLHNAPLDDYLLGLLHDFGVVSAPEPAAG
jgi:hypothetical protein